MTNSVFSVNIFLVGLHKILALLEAEDPDVRIHAVKVVANLAAEGSSPAMAICSYIANEIYDLQKVSAIFLGWMDVFKLLNSFAEANQEKIVEAGGLMSLLRLLRSSEDETIHRVAAGAIANLAMNGKTQNPMIV